METVVRTNQMLDRLAAVPVTFCNREIAAAWSEHRYLELGSGQ